MKTYVMREKAILAIAWVMPKWLVVACAVRVGAHATTGKYSGQDMNELTLQRAVDRFMRG